MDAMKLLDIEMRNNFLEIHPNKKKIFKFPF